MNNFEAVLLFGPELSKTNLDKEDKSFKDQITSKKGKIIAEEDWGLRDLSYSINNNKKAFYKFFQLEINSSLIQEVKKNLTQNENILRHLFIKVKDHEELPTKIIKSENK